MDVSLSRGIYFRKIAEMNRMTIFFVSQPISAVTRMLLGGIQTFRWIPSMLSDVVIHAVPLNCRGRLGTGFSRFDAQD
jgi:hypothetical protein